MANSKRYVVIYPTIGLMGAIATVTHGERHHSFDEAQQIAKDVIAKGATERARFDLALVVEAARSGGVYMAMPKPMNVPTVWRYTSSTHLASL